VQGARGTNRARKRTLSRDGLLSRFWFGCFVVDPTVVLMEEAIGTKVLKVSMDMRAMNDEQWVEVAINLFEQRGITYVGESQASNSDDGRDAADDGIIYVDPDELRQQARSAGRCGSLEPAKHGSLDLVWRDSNTGVGPVCDYCLRAGHTIAGCMDKQVAMLVLRMDLEQACADAARNNEPFIRYYRNPSDRKSPGPARRPRIRAAMCVPLMQAIFVIEGIHCTDSDGKHTVSREGDFAVKRLWCLNAHYAVNLVEEATGTKVIKVSMELRVVAPEWWKKLTIGLFENKGITFVSDIQTGGTEDDRFDSIIHIDPDEFMHPTEEDTSNCTTGSAKPGSRFCPGPDWTSRIPILGEIGSRCEYCHSAKHLIAVCPLRLDTMRVLRMKRDTECGPHGSIPSTSLDTVTDSDAGAVLRHRTRESDIDHGGETRAQEVVGGDSNKKMD